MAHAERQFPSDVGPDTTELPEAAVVEGLSPVEKIRAKISEIHGLLDKNQTDIHNCVHAIGACASDLVGLALEGGEVGHIAQEDYNRRHSALVERRNALVTRREQLQTGLKDLETKLERISTRR